VAELHSDKPILLFRVTEFCSDKPILSFWVSEINLDNAKLLSRVTGIFRDNATHVWLKTSRSRWLCFQSETQAAAQPGNPQGLRQHSQPNRRVRRGWRQSFVLLLKSKL